MKLNKNKLILLLMAGFLNIHAAEVMQVVAEPQRALAAQDVYPEGSIIRAWALKNLLTTTPEQDLYQSPLLGVIATENGTIKKWYGEFTDTADPDTGRFKRKFTTATPLEEITRLFFDQMDEKIRCVASGSNPVIGLTAQQVGQWVQLIKEKGIKGFTTVFGKKEGKPAKKGSPETAEQQQQKEFLSTWFTTYQSRPESGKFTDAGRLRRWVESLSAHLEALVTSEGEKTAIKQFLTILMSYLYLKDLQEAIKRPEYSIANYFKALGVEYQASFYRETDREILEKKIVDGSLGDGPEALEDIVFYMISFMKNDYDFLLDGTTHYRKIPICVESALRTMFNFILYNFEKKKFDFSLLPDAVQKSVNPNFKTFFETYNNPLDPNLFGKTTEEWFFLVKETSLKRGLDEAFFGSKDNVLAACNYFLGTNAGTFVDFGSQISTDTHTVKFGPYNAANETVSMDIRDGNRSVLGLLTTMSMGHADFKLRTTSYTNIFIGDKSVSGRYTFRGYNSIAFKVLKSLQSKYGIILIGILLEQDSNDIIDEAFKQKDINIIDWLIESGSINVNDINKTGETFLIRALPLRTINILKKLLDNGAQASINAQDGFGRTALYYAVLNNDINAVNLFIAYGADPSLADRDGTSPIDLAKDQDVLLRILQPDTGLKLIEAIRNGFKDQIESLLSTPGVATDTVNTSNQTALQIALEIEDFETVDRLMEYGIGNSISIINAQKKSPLIPIIASKKLDKEKKLEMIKFFIENGASSSLVNEHNDSGLGAALILGDIDILDFLLKNGAESLLSIGFNYQGQFVTPLELSLKLMHSDDFQKLLLKHGADPRILSGVDSYHKFKKKSKEPAVSIFEYYKKKDFLKEAAEDLNQAGIPIPGEDDDDEGN